MIRRYVKSWERYPKGYGHAWRLFHLDVSVAYPIPLHWFARWGRDFYYWLARPKFKSRLEDAERKIAIQYCDELTKFKAELVKEKQKGSHE